MKKALSTLIILITCCCVAMAQKQIIPGVTTLREVEEDFLSNPYLNYGGTYSPYPEPDGVSYVAAPKGYEPFYMSHYGRHGSRHPHLDRYYDVPYNILMKADSAGVLNDLGKSLLERVETMHDLGHIRMGELTERGIREHRGIAQRMYEHFPQIFARKSGGVVRSRSTSYQRTIMSMLSNNERLRELNPKLGMERDASSKGYIYLLDQWPEPEKEYLWGLSDKYVAEHFDYDSFWARILTDPSYGEREVTDKGEFARDLHVLAVSCLSVDYPFDFYDVLTPEDFLVLEKGMNFQMYNRNGSSPRRAEGTLGSVNGLLRDFIDKAEEVLCGERSDIVADLRFGHDNCFMPLISALGVNGYNIEEYDPDAVFAVWQDYKITPKAANIQFVFYRNMKNSDAPLIVKVLMHEREATLPIKPYAPGAFYLWDDLKAYFEETITKNPAIK